MNRRPSLISAVAVALACVAVGVAVLVPDGDGPPPSPASSVTPAERQLPVTPKPESAPQPGPTFDSGEAGLPLASSDAPGKTENEEARIHEANRAEARDDDDELGYDVSKVLQGAAGEPTRRSCPTSMNGGPRAVSSITIGVGHVTVSRNLAGTRDGDALCQFFRRVKASPTWTVDNEGNSWENVRLSLVPWTQAFYNRASCSVEYIGSTGRPGEGPAEWTVAQVKEGARLFAKCFAAARIPARNAIVRDGRVVQSGFTTHQELGSLGGGHTDPGPFFMREAQLFWIRQYLAGGASTRPGPDLSRLTKGERRAADCLLAERRVAKRHGGWDKVNRSHLRRAERCKASLETRNRELHRLGLTGRANRRDRHSAIHSVL